ncbi:hypothetical protein BDP27DRAFT_519037 [Rhodocollybia butyracea]|uniref:Uncharacterized protein n=1 Tax=Rhodocollybia butyracea TaxID=206335 RepID=A0A9P5PYJ2_9AGAR|nr:hypothetical protein BDP27DRAFT_519037 [Rhodocollybia butyracea]
MASILHLRTPTFSTPTNCDMLPETERNQAAALMADEAGDDLFVSCVLRKNGAPKLRRQLDN